MADDEKLSLQAFLQLLASKNLTISRAMTVAGKIYKEFNTPARLGELTDSKLLSLGVSDKEDRRLVLSALNAAGYRALAVTNAKHHEVKKRRVAIAIRTPGAQNDDDGDGDADDDGISLSPPKDGGDPSTPPKAQQQQSPLPTPSSSSSPRKKRKRGDATTPSSSSSRHRSRVEENEFLPSPATDDDSVAALGSLDFHELLDEDALRHKFTVVNRAPVMMAWACVVAERLGFSRDEALSIASVYTEMNAVSKGVSLGIFDKKRETDLKAAHAGGAEAQPYVDLLGRRIPLFRIASGSWRAFTTEDSNGNSTPGGGGAAPRAAHSYITRALRQTAPAVLGAMRLLAESYDDPAELNRVGFSLYADFRPDVNGWGKRGELKCETLLALQKKGPKGEPGQSRENSRVETTGNSDHAAVKHEVPYEEPAHSEPDDALRGAPVGDESEMEPNTLLDISFDEFTAEELSVLP